MSGAPSPPASGAERDARAAPGPSARAAERPSPVAPAAEASAPAAGGAPAADPTGLTDRAGPSGPEVVLTLELASPEATEALARALAPRLGAGDALLLEGPLGAGKTAFARALIQALLAREGRAEEVPSPSYTLVQSYSAGALAIWHADLYRLSGPEEAEELGLAEAFAAALCLVEWPDRLGALAPADALRLAFALPEAVPGELADPGRRQLSLRASGPRSAALLAALRAEAQ